MLVICLHQRDEGWCNEEVTELQNVVNGRYKLSEFEFSQQYLFFWDHEQVLVHPDTGIEYLSPMKKELQLIAYR